MKLEKDCFTFIEHFNRFYVIIPLKIKKSIKSKLWKIFFYNFENVRIEVFNKENKGEKQIYYLGLL